MRERYFQTTVITRLQRWSWYLLAIWFGIASLLSFVSHPQAGIVARWGVVAILAVIGLKVVIIAELFRAARLYRYWLLGYMLLVILLFTVILKTYLAA
ncbi:MAG: hypothetical protein KKB37_17100 [Alphaproteobacteria bacterium]|nr:hypothetical protein [Alphaproteobacteria bacterium]